MEQPLPLHHSDWALLILLATGVIAGYLKWTFPRKFSAFVSLPFNRKYLNQFAQNDGFAVAANFAFYLTFALALTLSNAAQEGRGLIFEDWKEYLRFLLFAAIAFNFQNFVSALIGWVFERGREVGDQMTVKSATRHWAFLILAPLCAAVIFVPHNFRLFFALPVLAFLGFYLQGTIRALRAIRPAGPFSTSYIFLYFCTLEILPLIILFKWLSF